MRFYYSTFKIFAHPTVFTNNITEGYEAVHLINLLLPKATSSFSLISSLSNLLFIILILKFCHPEIAKPLELHSSSLHFNPRCLNHQHNLSYVHTNHKSRKVFPPNLIRCSPIALLVLLKTRSIKMIRIKGTEHNVF